MCLSHIEQGVSNLQAWGMGMARSVPPRPGCFAQDMTEQQFLDTMAVDKKVQDGQLRLILLRGPLGGCVITGDFDHNKLHETLEHFCN